MTHAVAIMLQARATSQRLPGKVLMPIGGEPMIAQIIKRVRRSHFCEDFFLLTTELGTDDPVAELGTQLGVKVVRGSEADVLSRFVTALDKTDAEVVVRLTGDNPFVDGALIDYVLAAYFGTNPRADYANNIENSGFPYGLSAEIVRRSILLEVAQDGHAPMDREHVTYYVRQRPDRYRLQTIHAPGPFGVESVTVDTREQYRDVSGLFQALLDVNPDFTFYDLMRNTTASNERT